MARVFDGAWIDAMQVDTGLVWRTVRVVGALDAGAGLVGVSGQAGRASARGLMLDSFANGVASTWKVVGAANGCAFSQSAGVSGFTLRVGLTSNSHTFNFRIAIKSGLK